MTQNEPVGRGQGIPSRFSLESKVVKVLLYL